METYIHFNSFQFFNTFIGNVIDERESVIAGEIWQYSSFFSLLSIKLPCHSI